MHCKNQWIRATEDSPEALRIIILAAKSRPTMRDCISGPAATCVHNSGPLCRISFLHCKNQWIRATEDSPEALRIISPGSQITAHYAERHFWTCSDVRPITCLPAHGFLAHYAGLHADAEFPKHYKVSLWATKSRPTMRDCMSALAPICVS